MSVNFLNLNENKTELIVFGDSELLNVGTLCPFYSSVKSFGVYFDSVFKFDKQISFIARSSFFYLKLIAKVKAYLPPEDLERVIYTISTCLLQFFV